MIHSVASLFENQNAEEVAKWIKKFSQAETGKFAVVKISGQSIDDFLPDIAEALTTLSKLELLPIVVYGWGNALTERLKSLGIETKIHLQTGDRITKPEEMKFVRTISAEYGLKITNALEKRNIQSDLICGVFGAVLKKLPDINYAHKTGRITNTNISSIINTIENGKIPVVSPLGTNYSHQNQELLNINADSAAKALVEAIKPLKYIALTNKGGILDSKGKIITTISIEKDYERLITDRIVINGMKKKLDEAKDLVTALKGEVTVEIVHPKNLLIELFTDKGKGTYIYK